MDKYTIVIVDKVTIYNRYIVIGPFILTDELMRQLQVRCVVTFWSHVATARR